MTDSHHCRWYLAIIVATLLVSSAQVLGEDWPAILPSDGTAMLPAQEWPLKPGPRQIRVYLYYPGGSVDHVKPTTGLMLSLHNWGGTAAVGTADPKFLVDRYDVVAVCVDYLQSGKYEPTVPYDFGYLQALDALRALWWVFDGLEKLGKPFARGRIFATGGSGGGNVTLMANKLAPRTFACIVDCSGMAKLNDEIAYGLDGGSKLNAGWSRDKNNPHYLSPDAQELRFVGHPRHLATMKTLGNTCKVIVSHGSNDTACPTNDAREMVVNMKAAGIDVEGHFITDTDLDGQVLKDTGHAVGNRTLIVDRFAGEYLAPGGPKTLARKTKCDFELRDERVRYATPNGVWVISYVRGFPVGRFVASTSQAASRSFEATSLRAPANLVSNSSFEGDRDGNGAPDGWTFYANPKYASLSDQKALHGKRSILVDRPVLPGIVHVSADQWIPIVPGHAYTLTAWVLVERCNVGFARIYLDYYDAAKNRVAVDFAETKSRTTDWTRLTITLKAPSNAAFARVLVPYVDGDTRVFTDCVTLTSPTGGLAETTSDTGDLRVERIGCNFVHLKWTSNASRHKVDYRHVGKPGWQTDTNVCSAFHSVIMLRPETDYEFRVRSIPPRRLDEDGRLIDVGMKKDPLTVGARTTAATPKEWLGLKLWPTWHVDTFPGNTTYPCIEFFEGFLYVLEVRDGLYLSKIRPDGFKPEWTRRIVQPTGGYMGIPDMCVFRDKLYVMWNRQDTHKPGYVITKSMQWFLACDLRTGQLSSETAIEPAKPGCGTWEGGLDVYQGKVWMMWLEVWINEEGKRRTRLVLRPHERSEFTGLHVFDNCPSAYPYGPSVSNFDGKLILLWSDLEANEKDPEREPLYCTFFDGRQFSASTKVHDIGQNRYAKGAQLGEAFYCVFKSNSQYPKSRYMYHDLALSRIGPGGREIRTTYWVDDVNYNSSPDMCRAGDVLYVVFGKFEHLYGSADDPAINHGAFWGKIAP